MQRNLDNTDYFSSKSIRGRYPSTFQAIGQHIPVHPDVDVEEEGLVNRIYRSLDDGAYLQAVNDDEEEESSGEEIDSHSEMEELHNCKNDNTGRDRLVSSSREEFDYDSEMEELYNGKNDNTGRDRLVSPCSNKSYFGNVALNGDDNENDVVDSSKGELQQQINRLVRYAREAFLDGKDQDFDYALVDYDPAYDDLDVMSRDAEDAYFDSEVANANPSDLA